MDLTAFGPYALNVRTNISSYGHRAGLTRAYYKTKNFLLRFDCGNVQDEKTIELAAFSFNKK